MCDMPESVTPGVPLRFATTLPLAGYGRGVVGISLEGRPIKIEGNPLHPASLGATDVFAEAAVLRSTTPTARAPRARRRDRLLGHVSAPRCCPVLERSQAREGEGLRLLTGPRDLADAAAADRRSAAALPAGGLACP